MSQCPQCHSQIPPDSPDGVCPQCILNLGFEPAVTAATPGGSHGRFVAPSIEQLAPQFPQLDLMELIGQGGMGAVYRANQKSLSRPVALKVLPAEIAQDPTFAERFSREARAMAKMQHPNIVTIYESGRVGDLYYFIMEYVDGVNLREAIQARTFSPVDALAIVPQICDALQYAHDEGIVHRDIKPENILIDRKGRVKIADFGLAKLLGSDPADLTLTGTRQVVGTWHYMAPEQMEKPLAVDHRADIYSLGVVFYELLTGELPLGRFSPPSEISPTQRSLDDVVLKTLEKEPMRRFQHASDVKTAVHAAAQAPPVVHPPVQQMPRRKSGTQDVRRLLSVPFYINDAYTGFAQASGIIRCTPQGLVIQFEIQDTVLQVVKSGTKTVEIDYDKLVDLQLQRRWYGTYLRIQCDDLTTVSAVPRSEAGVCELVIKSANILKAQRLVEVAQACMEGIAWEDAIHVCGDAAREGELLLAAAKKQVAGPAWMLFAAGLIDLLVIVAFAVTILSLLGRRSTVHGVNIAFMLAILVQIPVPPLLIGSALTMRQLKGYGLGVFGSILAMLPIHAGFLLGIAAGIWSLITLSREDVRRAFRMRRSASRREAVGDLPLTPDQPVKPANLAAVSRRIALPGRCLIVLGVLVLLSPLGLLLWVLTGSAPGIFELLIVSVPSIVSGSLMMYGGTEITRQRNYAGAILGTIGALVPMNVFWLLTLPIGIWALVTLMSAEARLAFQSGPAAEQTVARKTGFAAVFFLALMGAVLLAGFVVLWALRTSAS